MTKKTKLKIGIFVDHDIIVRHFLYSDVFCALFSKHDVDVILPPVGYKRITLDPSEKIGSASIVRLPVHSKSRFLWGRMMQVMLLRPLFSRRSLSTRLAWRRFTPIKVELLHTILALPFVYTLYRVWTFWQSGKSPNLLMRALFEQQKYDIVINPGLPGGHYFDDLFFEKTRAKIPLIFIMNSWDNPSTGRFASGKPDIFLAWGEQTKKHAIEYQGMKSEDIIKFGAAQFEVYSSQPKLDRKEFCQINEIDDDDTIILYAGGSLGTNEFDHLKLLEQQIESGIVKKSVVVYRPHPWGGGANAAEKIIEGQWRHVTIESSMRDYLLQIKERGYHLSFPDYEHTHSVLSAVDCVISPLSTILIEAALHGKPIMCFLPIEEIEARAFQTVHRFPHFQDLQHNPEVILASGRDELITKLPNLISRVGDVNLSKKLIEECEYFVANHKLPYSDRLIDLVETTVHDSTLVDCSMKKN